MLSMYYKLVNKELLGKIQPAYLGGNSPKRHKIDLMTQKD